jgi:hypothetical protein
VVGLAGYTLETGLAGHLSHTGTENGSHYTAPTSLPEANALVSRLEPTDVDAAVASYLAGSSARQVAAELGVSKSGLLDLLRRRGVEPRQRRSLDTAQVDEAIRLYRSGCLLREIGDVLGVSRDGVRLALRSRGVAMRRGACRLDRRA